jgi:hypothetical protein
MLSRAADSIRYKKSVSESMFLDRRGRESDESRYHL